MFCEFCPLNGGECAVCKAHKDAESERAAHQGIIDGLKKEYPERDKWFDELMATMKENREAKGQPVVYVDIPNPETVGRDDNAWMNLQRFRTKADAVAWIRANIGPCDDDGNICLITNG